MSNLNFYERQLEFQNKLNKIHDEQIKLENEFQKLNIPAPVTSSERVLELEAYHKKICERERMAKERNYRMLKEFDEMKRMMATMQLQTARLKQAKIKCMREVERLFPEWKQQLQLNRAQEQLKPNTSTKNQLGMTYPPLGGTLTSTPTQKTPVHSSMSNLSMPPPPPPEHLPRPVQINAPALASPKSVIHDSLSSMSEQHQPKPNDVISEPERDVGNKMIDVTTNDEVVTQKPVELKHNTDAANSKDSDRDLKAIGEQMRGISPALEVEIPTIEGKGDNDEDVKDDASSDDDDDDIPTDSFFNSSNDEDKSEVKNVEIKLPNEDGDDADDDDNNGGVDADERITEPFTSVHDSVETFNTPIVIPGLKESTLESTFSDTATSVTSQQGNTPLAASSAYQALRDTMDGSILPSLSNPDDDDVDDAENLLSPNATIKKKQTNNETAASSDDDCDDDISSILSSEDDAPARSSKNSGQKSSAYQPSMASQPKQQPITKPKRYRAPWESDSDDGLDEKPTSTGKKNMDDDDFDFYD